MKFRSHSNIQRSFKHHAIYAPWYATIHPITAEENATISPVFCSHPFNRFHATSCTSYCARHLDSCLSPVTEASAGIHGKFHFFSRSLLTLITSSTSFTHSRYTYTWDWHPTYHSTTLAVPCVVSSLQNFNPLFPYKQSGKSSYRPLVYGHRFNIQDAYCRLLI